MKIKVKKLFAKKRGERIAAESVKIESDSAPPVLISGSPITKVATPEPTVSSTGSSKDTYLAREANSTGQSSACSDRLLKSSSDIFQATEHEISHLDLDDIQGQREELAAASAANKTAEKLVEIPEGTEVTEDYTEAAVLIQSQIIEELSLAKCEAEGDFLEVDELVDFVDPPRRLYALITVSILTFIGIISSSIYFTVLLESKIHGPLIRFYNDHILGYDTKQQRRLGTWHTSDRNYPPAVSLSLAQLLMGSGYLRYSVAMLFFYFSVFIGAVATHRMEYGQMQAIMEYEQRVSTGG
ncbi:uncharacterized protein V1518DRAFT_415358 [Limtongia smithiae]|uniref:uncharacterized protein n=1 Tax=Limtongia smithiae TaxID=1125753 RepID=UPI0034CD7001